MLESQSLDDNGGVKYYCMKRAELSRQWYDCKIWPVPAADERMQVKWRPTEDVGKHDQCKTAAPLRAVSLLLRTMEKGPIDSL